MVLSAATPRVQGATRVQLDAQGDAFSSKTGSVRQSAVGCKHQALISGELGEIVTREGYEEISTDANNVASTMRYCFEMTPSGNAATC